ncbi:TIGR04086 family membrane protein [Bacillus sp. AGMB 02131]|uniref:TIGR04086 family membrane protein n=1 Tax=Peribacillus faecalis TaxID=2772559 RepID=A0A927CUL2_9BACI|nr:TIGR04086 family membrane protein [Peribacillus faecalis]MBD3107863.1 TIGR04086 family membrane protein [Peribacillus faecalis]
METRKMGSAIVYGTVSIFIFAIIFSLFFSLLLRFTSLTESSISYLILILSFISIFIGGLISGGKGKRQGLLLGGGTGLLYTLIILAFQYLGFDQTFTAKEWIQSLCYVLVCMMGGVLGVNLSGGNQK